MKVTGIADLLSTLDADERRRGRQFEEICRWFLTSDPVYARQLRKVWLWDDWPGRWGDEAGIDLVAETRDRLLWAIQAKAYQPEYSIKKADVDTFLSESARAEFSYRLLIATTDRIGRLGQRTIDAQEKPVGCLLLHDLKRAELTWPTSLDDLRPAASAPKQPLPHQAEAIEAVVKGLVGADRGQLIMACGTGKTLISLWISEALNAQRTLVLVPSLSLLKQTIREWLLNSERDFDFLPVCSDDTVRDHDQMVANVSELGLPATGNPKDVASFLKRPGPRIVFSTYQSSPVVANAMKGRVPAFNLVIADEAHRCAGPVSSDFATVLEAKKIRAKKRLFMTATPRYFTGRVLKAGRDADFEIASMDDSARFGPVLHKLSFGEAIDRDLLSDYRVLVAGVDDETYRQYVNSGRFVTRGGKDVTDARSLASQIVLAKAMRDFDLRRVITFHGRVKAAKMFAESFPEITQWMPPEERPDGTVWADHVSGTMNSSERSSRVQRLHELGPDERGVLANARCLAEGVDIPTLDGIAFIDPKQSEVDIVQAVGRAIRKAEPKRLSTVVIPIYIDTAVDLEAQLEGSPFKAVWNVIWALRGHDEDLGQALDELRSSLGERSTVRIKLPPKITVDLPAHVGEEFVRAFETTLVEKTATSTWQYFLSLFRRFVSQEGHGNVSSNYSVDGQPLGDWVARQRQEYAKDRLSKRRTAELQRERGWEWGESVAYWEQGISLLQEFQTVFGTTFVPWRTIDEHNFPLGEWVSWHRENRKKLTKIEKRRLEAIEGWDWEEPDHHAPEWKWEHGLMCLKCYVFMKGHALASKRYYFRGGANFGDRFFLDPDFHLGQWVGDRRYQYHRGELFSEQIAQLESFPFWCWEEPMAGESQRLSDELEENPALSEFHSLVRRDPGIVTLKREPD